MYSVTSIQNPRPEFLKLAERKGCGARRLPSFAKPLEDQETQLMLGND